MALRHLTCVLVLIVGAGCGASSQTRMMEAIDLDATAAEAQFRLQNIEPRYLESISAAAERALVSTRDPEEVAAIRRARNRLTALARAAFNSADPFVAGADAWALALQIERYYTGGDGRAELGPSADVMAELGRALADDIETSLIVSLAEEDIVNQGRSNVRRWALEHPLRPGLQRDSVLSMLPEASYDDVNLPSTVQDIARDVSSMRHQLNLRASELSGDLKWEVLELLDVAFEEERVGKALADLEALGDVSRSVEELIRDTPTIIAGERNRILGAVGSEREIVLRAVDGQRVEAFESITAERVAILEAVTREREAVMEGLHDERVAATGDVERIADELVDRAAERAVDVVDHVFWRMAQLGALFFVGLFGYRAFATWLSRRERKHDGG